MLLEPVKLWSEHSCEANTQISGLLASRLEIYMEYFWNLAVKDELGEMKNV